MDHPSSRFDEYDIQKNKDCDSKTLYFSMRRHLDPSRRPSIGVIGPIILELWIKQQRRKLKVRNEYKSLRVGCLTKFALGWLRRAAFIASPNRWLMLLPQDEIIPCGTSIVTNPFLISFSSVLPPTIRVVLIKPDSVRFKFLRKDGTLDAIPMFDPLFGLNPPSGVLLVLRYHILVLFHFRERRVLSQITGKATCLPNARLVWSNLHPFQLCAVLRKHAERLKTSVLVQTRLLPKPRDGPCNPCAGFRPSRRIMPLLSLSKFLLKVYAFFPRNNESSSCRHHLTKSIGSSSEPATC